MFGLLRKRGVLFLGLSNTVSQLGDRLTYMAIVTLIGTIAPGRISAFSEFSATFTLPIIILSPFVGVVIDHSNKQRIMLRCHLIQSLLIFIAPTFIMLTRSMTPIWILVVLFYSLEVFNNTSRNCVVPDLVDYGDLVPANSIINTLSRFATFIGMVGGGYLIAKIGWRYGFYVNATTHLIAGTLVLGMGARILFEPVRKLKFSLTRELRKSFNLFLADLKELGILLTKDRMVIFVMLSVLILPFVAAVAHTVLVFLVQQQFELGTAGVGIFGGIIGVGMLNGAVLMGHIGKRRISLGELLIYTISIVALFFVQNRFGFGNSVTISIVAAAVLVCRVVMGYFGERVSRGMIILYSVAILAVSLFAGPFFVTPHFIYVVAFVSGAIFSFIGISQDTILQEDVMKDIRGRIFATKEFLLNLTLLCSAMLVGIASHFLKPYTIIRCAGAVLFVVLAFAVLVYRSIPYEIRSKL
ncbi:MAG: MFS transporter [candidate division WOR-3 bacterium]|nr:MAG: MFS transporter [candidate division WOR-3 bacterium]